MRKRAAAIVFGGDGAQSKMSQAGIDRLCGGLTGGASGSMYRQPRPRRGKLTWWPHRFTPLPQEHDDDGTGHRSSAVLRRGRPSRTASTWPRGPPMSG